MNWANVFSQNMNLRSLCLYIFELISFKDTCSLTCSVNKLLVHIMFKATLPIPTIFCKLCYVTMVSNSLFLLSLMIQMNKRSRGTHTFLLCANSSSYTVINVSASSICTLCFPKYFSPPFVYLRTSHYLHPGHWKLTFERSLCHHEI